MSDWSPDRLIWHGSSHLGWGAVAADTPGWGGSICLGWTIGQGSWTIVTITRWGLGSPFRRRYEALHSSHVQQLQCKQTVRLNWPSREGGGRQMWLRVGEGGGGGAGRLGPNTTMPIKIAGVAPSAVAFLCWDADVVWSSVTGKLLRSTCNFIDLQLQHAYANASSLPS